VVFQIWVKNALDFLIETSEFGQSVYDAGIQASLNFSKNTITKPLVPFMLAKFRSEGHCKLIVTDVTLVA